MLILTDHQHRNSSSVSWQLLDQTGLHSQLQFIWVLNYNNLVMMHLQIHEHISDDQSVDCWSCCLSSTRSVASFVDTQECWLAKTLPHASHKGACSPLNFIRTPIICLVNSGPGISCFFNAYFPWLSWVVHAMCHAMMYHLWTSNAFGDLSAYPLYNKSSTKIM